MVDIASANQSLRSSFDRCDKVIITAGTSFNWKNRKKNVVLATIVENDEIEALIQLLRLEWFKEDQGWWHIPSIYLNAICGRELSLSVGVANRAMIKLECTNDSLRVVNYEQFGDWLEAHGINPYKIYT